VAELEKKEQELIRAIQRKAEPQDERMNRLGIGTGATVTVVSNVPPQPPAVAFPNNSNYRP
jgi:hypothetical protein